jgi:hypothetical protein
MTPRVEIGKMRVPAPPSLSPDPGFEYFFKACRKGDATAKAVTVGDSAVRMVPQFFDSRNLGQIRLP